MTCDAVKTSLHTPVWHLPFLVENCTWLWPGRAVPMVQCQFDIAYYRDSLFDELQIPLPDCIRQSVTRRRAEFLAGRYCALRALDILSLQHVNVGIGKHGSPVWPRGFTGSLSHSQNEAVALVMQHDNHSPASNAGPPGLGIDIEKIVSPETATNIACRVLNVAERALVAATAASPQLLLTLAFSAKESFFKAAYPIVGHYFDFDAVSVIDFDLQFKAVRLRVRQALHAALPPGRELEVTWQMLSAQQIMTRVVIG